MRVLLIFLSVLFITVIIFQILSIYDLANFLKGKKGYEVTDKESKIQGWFVALGILLLFVFIGWLTYRYADDLLPTPGSYEGDEIAFLDSLTWWIIMPVFFLTHIAIAYFCVKYPHKKTRRATYYTHNNKLELLWTMIPALTLTVIVLFSLKTWNSITTPIPADQKHILIGVYSKQFSWTARYAGRDNRLGRADVRLITPTDPLGVDTTDSKSFDDKIVMGEMHLPKDIPVQFDLRAQDVIHSFFLPEFRAQMNCVPGMTTQFKFTPKYTTKEMRKITKNPKFDYILLCNKVCGAAHYNMKMKVVVDSKKDFYKWLAQQDAFRPNGTTAETTKTTQSDTLKTAQLTTN